MRIAHVVTYVSRDSAFGGPIAVATAQAEELAVRGHHVDFLAGWDGDVSFSIPGVRVGLFPVKRVAPGLSGLASPSLIRYLLRNARHYDVIHVHMGRDLVTLPAAAASLSRSRRVVLQTHGMVMPDRRPKARFLDAILTRRALERSDSIFVLSDVEREGIARVAAPLRPEVIQIANGVARRKVVSVPTDPPTVLFLARLHPRKQVMVFAEAARLMKADKIRAKFRVVGPDEGDLARLLSFRDAHRLDALEYVGSVPAGAAVKELASASIYVLPSYGEVFPMTVLEAFVAGTPVVLGEDCAIAPELVARGAVETTTSDPAHLATVLRALLTEPDRRVRLTTAAHLALEEWLTIEAVVDRLEEAYA